MRGSRFSREQPGTERGKPKVDLSTVRAAIETAFTAAERQRLPSEFISSTRRAHGPGINKSHNRMAWRPYENLMNGELDNRTPGKVTGWMRFYRRNKPSLKIAFDLEGDFHEDIRGTLIRLTNPNPSDWDRPESEGSHVDDLAPVQRGTVGDITAGLPLGPWTDEIAQRLMAQNELIWDDLGLTGSERETRRREFFERYQQHIAAGDLYHPYVSYPYIEWYSQNGRVVLELDPSQVEIVKGTLTNGKTPAELHHAEKKRNEAFGAFMAGLMKRFSDENRKSGGDGNVTGIVVS